MTSWQLGTAMNLVIAVAYLGIASAILWPLIRSDQWRKNRLGLATAAIFFTCAVHHGHHALHMLGPALGLQDEAGLRLREAWSWDIAIWDVLGAGAALYYWSLRKTYGSLMRGATLFEDLREKQRQALEINDNIVQSLSVAKLALEIDDRDRSERALEASLASARRIITDLLGETETTSRLNAGELQRRDAAKVSR